MNVIDFVRHNKKYELQEKVYDRLAMNPIISRINNGSLVVIDTVDIRKTGVFIDDYTDELDPKEFELTVDDFIADDWKFGRCMYGFTKLDSWDDFQEGSLPIFIKIDGDVDIIREADAGDTEYINRVFSYGEKGCTIFGFYPTINSDNKHGIVSATLKFDGASEKLMIETLNVDTEYGLEDISFLKKIDSDPTHWYMNIMNY